MTPEPTQEQTIAAFKERLRQKVEERKKNKLVTVNDQNRMIPLRDIAFGQVEACEWFLKLLDETH